MKLKLEILGNGFKIYEDNDDKDEFEGYTTESALSVVEEYAKQQAIAFAEYLREHNFHPTDKTDMPNWVQAGSKIGWLQPHMSIVKSTEKVFLEYQSKPPETIKP